MCLSLEPDTATNPGDRIVDHVSGMTALMQAASAGDLDVVHSLLEHNANPNRAKASEGSCVHVVLATAGAGHSMHAGPFARGVVHVIAASPNGPNRAPKPSPELAD